jgi:hypothetical protein
MEPVPKAVKRELRELANLAYEEELRRALQPLSAAFKRWDCVELSSDELSDLIHQVSTGTCQGYLGHIQYEYECARDGGCLCHRNRCIGQGQYFERGSRTSGSCYQLL